MKKLFVALLFFPLLALSQEKRPNIIFILADDLGARDCGFTGSDYYETPNLDQLAKEGMVFSNAYSGASNCAPSRACMLSGQYTPRHGVYAVDETDRGPKDQMRLTPVPNTRELDLSVYTIPEALKDAGYTTALFGKWHLGADDEHVPARQGFATFFDARSKKDSAEVTPDDPKSIYTVSRDGCNFMKEKKDSSFFLFLSYHAPHFPLEARSSSQHKFRAKPAGEYQRASMYAACIYDLDDGIGQVLRCLDSLGLSENTLVIFTSDNGSTGVSSSWPLRASKGTYYEGGIRVPLIVRWPGRIAVNSQCATPVINVDFYPTLLAAAGVEKRKAAVLDGENLLPVLSGGSKTLKRSCIFWHFPGYLETPTPRISDQPFRAKPLTAVRKGNWKLILYHEEWLLDGGKKNVSTNNSVELYNLEDDEGETKNLANENVSMRDELIQAIEDWWKATGAVLPSVKKQ